MTKQVKKRLAQVDEELCVGCGSCIKVCPRDAISVPRGIYAEINHNLCVGCGLCAGICPASVIEIVETVTGDERCGVR